MKRASSKLIAVVSLTALALSACGVRGSLDAPADNAIDNVEAAPQRDENGNVVAGQHDSFVLDRLIR